MTSTEPPRLRRDLLVEAQRLALDVDAIEDELELFHRRDLPAFERWLACTLGTERLTLNQLRNELNILRERHAAVLALAEAHDLSRPRALHLVEREDRLLARASAATRDRILLERARRRAIGEPRDAGAVLGPQPTLEHNLETVKTLYRRLARRLHPDAHADERDATEIRWRTRYWSELQRARENGDVTTLIALEAVTRLRHLDLKDLTTQDARRANAWLRREREGFNAERETARAHAAWDFARRTPEDAEARVRALFARELRNARDEHARLQRDLDRWRDAERDAPAPRARRPRRPPTRCPVTAAQQLSLFK